MTGSSADIDQGATANTQPSSSWVEIWRLVQNFPERSWVGPLLVILGLGAALAETLSVGLAVMLLFALLGQYDRIAEAGGFLARIHAFVQEYVGSDPTTVVMVFLALIVFNAILVYIYQVVTARMMNIVAQRVRDAVHDQYLTVSYRYLQAREQGQLLHILATETWSVADAFYHAARIGVSLCTILIFGTGLFLLSWIVGLTALLSATVVFALFRLLSRPVRRIGRETLAANQILAERMLVSLYGMRTLRVFAQEAYMLRIFGAASTRVRRLAIREETIKALIGPLGEIGSLGGLLLIVIVAGRAGVDVATIIAAVLLLFRLQPHLREIDASRLALAGLNASLRSVREMIDGEKPRAREGTEVFPGLKSELRFDRVDFRHNKDRGKALDALSLVIPRGNVVVIAGPSGSGKTTILNLILRLYDPDRGQITADGADFHAFTRTSWLSRVGVAGQDVELVEGTLAQNLRIGAHDASTERLRQICEMVEILDDIDALPDGFDTRIGNAGQSFSGGQRQRIGLARALLRAPEFLILDEAMSAIEPDREARIFARIVDMMTGGTVLVVSHRSAETYNPDTVIRVANGRIADST